MYRGRYQLGDEVPLALLCLDGSGTPQKPAECPTADVWSASAKVFTGQIPPPDFTRSTAWFAYRLFLGAAFAAGQYRVFYRYRVGATPYLVADTFEVTPGGSRYGPVLAMADFAPPHSQFVVQQSQSGSFLVGQNPRV